MNFPDNPANGDTYTAPNGTTYVYSDAKQRWSVVRITPEPTTDVETLLAAHTTTYDHDLLDQLKAVAISGAYADLTGRPTLAAVATSGSYNDLADIPDLGLADVATSGAYADLTGRPTLATVATTGSYNDLTDTPAETAAPTPIDQGALGATATIDWSVGVDYVGTVGSTAGCELTWTNPVAGARRSLLLIATGACTVTLPAGYWVFGSVWDGVMAAGERVRLSLYYSGTNYEYAWATLSQTDITVQIAAADVAVDVTETEVLLGTTVQSAMQQIDAALYALQSSVYPVGANQGTVVSAATVDFSEYARVDMTLGGDAALTLIAPTKPGAYKLHLTQDATGGHTPTWVTDVLWADGTEPVVASAAGALTVCTFEWTGAVWLGSAMSYA